MRHTTILMLGCLAALTSSITQAARLDLPEPAGSDDPVIGVSILEKDRTVTMTFRIAGTYNFDYILEKATVFESYEEPMNPLPHKANKGRVWEISFSMAKDKIASAWLHLTYIDPNHNPNETGGLNQVNLKIQKYYQHYKDKQKKTHPEQPPSGDALKAVPEE